MSDQILRNLLDACERGRPLADIHDRLRVEVGRLDAPAPAPADDEPTRALFKAQQAKVDAQAWAERVRTATTEVLDAEEVADIRSHVGQGAGVSQQMVRLLCDSHERLRAGVSPQPEIAPTEIEDAARELIAAEDEMYLLDRQHEESQEQGYNLESQAACLGRAIAARHVYADARRAMVALLADGATPAGPEDAT